MTARFATPLRVYGSRVSYFTGKLEGVLRWKGIPYERVPMTARLFNGKVRRATGAAQMPAVELPDGRWMTDTTPILEWLETEQPEPAVLPADPVQAFVSRLLEDYADEWLWRPAMHFRWSYAADARLLARQLTDEILVDLPVPAFLKRQSIYRRQFGTFVIGDGVIPTTRAQVEGVYHRSLAALEIVFRQRPFLLGEVPTLADFGFFGPMFRHFSMDPTPAALMRDQAPAVYEWVARLWNARADRRHGPLLAGIPADWAPLLEDVGAAYLPHLCANAAAFQAGQKRFDVTIQGASFHGLQVSRYRVWCLERLRHHFAQIPDGAQRASARELLEHHGCWEPLWRIDGRASGYDPEGRAPFGVGLPVF